MENAKPKKKKWKIVLVSVAGGVVVLGLVFTMFLGTFLGVGPFSSMGNLRFKNLEGNAEKYSVENAEELPENELSGKNILYLGSSVTFGMSGMQTSFAEYIAKRNNTTYVKEAVSGTTLVESMPFNYYSRLQNVDKNAKFDLFVCQLSTNDATGKKEIGTVDSSNTSTVLGAINHILDYVEETWNCKMAFYTGSYYESEHYSLMVDGLKEVSAKRDVTVIDLYTDKEFNNISDENRSLYMADDIHPTRAGYLEWWTPKFEEYYHNIF